MLNRKTTQALFIFLCAYTSASAQPDYLKAQWAWPTEASTLLSGTFGETRSAHFHAGIDVKTWGQEGYKVYASRDGVLNRIGVSPFGYGKVVYLRHGDGSYSVYAHLRDFEPGIRALVDSLRMITFPFRFDENLEKYNLRFKQGDLIAFTGSTGIGPPHLHFELRTPDEHPFNPLLANVKIKDSTPPRISGIIIEPLSTDAHINGKARITELNPSKGNDFGVITVGGTVGIAVNASDYADGATNVYAVYRLELFKDNELFFTSQADSFSYSNTSQMFLDRVFPVLMQTRRGYQRLYIRDGNTLPLYSFTAEKGRLRLPLGDHRVRIVATDYFGNKTQVNATLRVVKPSIIAPPKPLRSPELPQHIDYLPSNALSGIEWSNNGFSIPNVKSSTVDICNVGIVSLSMPCLSYQLGPEHTMALNSIDSAHIRIDGRNLGLFHRIYPSSNRTLYSANRRASVHFPAQSVYDTLSISFTAAVRNSIPSIALWPTHEPLRSSVRLTWLLDGIDASLQGWGWYQVDASGRKSAVSSTLDGGRLFANVSRMGTYEIHRDSIPPEVNSPRLIKDHAGRNQVVVRVRDDLSGVFFESAEFRVDGKRGIIEYEPGLTTLYWMHTEHIPSKGSTIEVILFDNAGNRTEFRSKL